MSLGRAIQTRYFDQVHKNHAATDDVNGVQCNDPDTSPTGLNEPEKKVLGIPYDLRRPTFSRVRSRLLNSGDPRMFPPKVFGVGWTINFYWVMHFIKYLHQKFTRRNTA